MLLIIGGAYAYVICM